MNPAGHWQTSGLTHLPPFTQGFRQIAIQLNMHIITYVNIKMHLRFEHPFELREICAQPAQHVCTLCVGDGRNEGNSLEKLMVR